MGLFDHLFKSKSPPSEERSVETGAKPAEPAKPSDAAARSTPPQRADPSAFLHPKSFVPRGVTPLPAPAKSSAITGVRKPGAPTAPPAVEEIVLTLGDVLSRIPTPYLKTGQHDPKRELRFNINDLSSDIARGRAAVPLSRIAQLVPDIFVKQIARDEDTEIRLPLQKLVEQIGLLRSRHQAGEKAGRQSAGTSSQPSPPIDVKARYPSLMMETTEPGRETLRDLVSMVEPIFELKPLEDSSALNRLVHQEPAIELKPGAEPLVAQFPVSPEAPALFTPPALAAEGSTNPVPEVAPSTIGSLKEVAEPPRHEETPERVGEGLEKPSFQSRSEDVFRIIGEPAPAPAEIPPAIPSESVLPAGQSAISAAEPVAPEGKPTPSVNEPVFPREESVASVTELIRPAGDQAAASAAETVRPAVESTVAPAAEAIRPVVESAAAPVAETTRPAVEPVIASVAEAIRPAVEPATASVAEAVRPAVEPAIASAAEAFRPVVEPAASSVAETVRPTLEPSAVVAELAQPTIEPAALVAEFVQPDVQSTPSITESIAPRVESAAPAIEPIAPRIESVEPAAEPILRHGEPVALFADPVSPRRESLSSFMEPILSPAASAYIDALPVVEPAASFAAPAVPAIESAASASEPILPPRQPVESVVKPYFVPNEPAHPSGEHLLPPDQIPAQERPLIAKTVVREAPEPVDIGGEKIQLSLAAILRQCPREIIVGELPSIPDSVRITLPFAPIDKQLSMGHVEISAVRFVAAIPFSYQKYFSARMGVKVTIPLEEVFQNLPSQANEAPAPSGPLPQILAPAVPEELETFPMETDSEIPKEMQPPLFASVPTISKEVDRPPLEKMAAVSKKAEPIPGEHAPAVPKEGEPSLVESTPAKLKATRHLLFEAVSAPVEAMRPLPFESAATTLQERPPAPIETAEATPLHVEVAQHAEDKLMSPTVSETPPASEAAEPGVPLVEPVPAPTAAPLDLPAFHQFVPPPPIIVPEHVEPVSVTPALSAESPVHPAAPTHPSAPAPLAPSFDSGPMEGTGDLHVPPRAMPHPGMVSEAGHTAMTPEPHAPEAAPEPQGEAAKLGPEPAVPHVAEPEQPPLAPRADSEPVSTSADDSVHSPQPVARQSEAGAEQPPTAPKEEAVAPAPAESPSAASSSTEATQPFRLPQIIRPFIVLPPPILGFTPAPEVPVESESQSSENKDVVVDITQDDEKNESDVAGMETSHQTPSGDAHEAPPQPVVLAAATSGAEPTEHPSIISIDFSQALVPPDEPPPSGRAPLVEMSDIPPHSPEKSIPQDVPASEAGLPVPPVPETVTGGHVESVAPPSQDAAAVPAAERPVETSPESAAFVAQGHFVEPVSPPTAPPAVKLNPEPISEQGPEPVIEPAIWEQMAATLAPSKGGEGEPAPLLHVPELTQEEFSPAEVLPPPALPLRRFDQDSLQALFMTDEVLDLTKISRLAAQLPGVHACVIATRDQACTGGTLPEGFDLAALLGLAPRVGEAAGRMPIGGLKHFTLYGERYSISFFARNGLSLCAVHRPRSFVPGVREKLVAIADELSK